MKNTISRPVPRTDGPDKTSGKAKYIADYPIAGVLHGRLVLSKKPRARILSIALPELPPGYHALSGEDFPASNRVHMIHDDWPFFAEGEVSYLGQPLLLLLGEDREVLHGLVSAVRVEYEELPAVYSLEESEKGKTIIFGRDNSFASYKILKGEPEKSFKAAARIFEGIYETGAQEHIYMEPQGMLAEYKEGVISVYGSMQCPYYIKNALLAAFGFPEDKIRVVSAVTGGGFGGKEDFPSLLAGYAALGTYKTGRPVRIILDRSEDISITPKRHPSKISIKTALSPSEEISAMDISILLDGGAYEGLSAVVLQRALFAATGIYRVPNLRVTARALATNTVPNGAFRGFGAPQSYFAIETHMNELAKYLGRAPLEFKNYYCLKKGDSTITSGTIKENPNTEELIKRLKDLSGIDPFALPEVSIMGTKKTGYGLSFFKHGCGFTGSGERDKIKALVKLEKHRDDTVEILASNTEMGQGPITTLPKIVSETLGIPLSAVIYRDPDTARVPDSGPTVASRTAMIVGNLVRRAALSLKDKWIPGEAQKAEARYTQPEEIVWDQDNFIGDAYPDYSWGINLAEACVDTETFEIEIKRFWAVYDTGTPLDEEILRGQMEGGIAQGIGYATIEVLKTREGRFLQGSMTDYIIPTSEDAPEIKVAFAANPTPYGPFGAKGAGELPFVGAGPAVSAAVSHALGRSIRKLPITPEDLLEECSR